MIEAALIFGLLAGMWAEMQGNRAVRPLIASVALSCVLILVGVGFDFGLWTLIDAAVIFAIEKTAHIGWAERLIFASFVPVWILYHLQPEGWRDAVVLIVAGQFLLTVPWSRLRQRILTEKTA